jgi:TolB-like protein
MPSFAVPEQRRYVSIGSFLLAYWVSRECAMGVPSVGPALSDKTTEKRLDSWKEIATYLNRDVTTVQRWEKREGMPVHQHLHNSRGSVYALTSELDTWVEGRRLSLSREVETAEAVPETPATDELPDRVWSGRKSVLWLLSAIAGVALCILSWLVYRAHSNQPQIRSLVVLPMRNLSGDLGQDYLADGMTEALTGRLAEIHNLRVTSYTSARRFRDSKLSVPEIAKTLGVDAVVEGSVQREGDRMRVTAQLIRGTTDEHFWSETYDREIKDALTLESDLAQAIAEKVKVTITGQEQERLTAARSVAPEVYESYLKGRYALDGADGRVRIDESVGYFNDAIAKDPTFAPAYLGLAVAYQAMGLVASGEVPQETRPKVIVAARRALELDPNLPRAHMVLAATLQAEWHWAEAESEYKRALELGPMMPIHTQAMLFG